MISINILSTAYNDHQHRMNSLKSPAPVIKRLRSLLQDLNASLDPITSQPLDQLTTTLENRTKTESNSKDDVILTGRLESAQLQSSLAYILLDLVWILLKVHGTDPISHPVTAELKRVQQYLEKVHKTDKNLIATNGKQSGSAPEIDQGKASRFIKGALGSNSGSRSTGKRTVFAEDGTVERIVPVGSEQVESETKDESTDAKEDNGQSTIDGDEGNWEQPRSKRRKSDKGEKKKTERKSR